MSDRDVRGSGSDNNVIAKQTNPDKCSNKQGFNKQCIAVCQSQGKSFERCFFKVMFLLCLFN